MTGLDSNVLVRYFTRDDEAQARAARKFIERAIGVGERLHVSLVALAELAWVLRSRYKVKRNEVSTLVESCVSKPAMAPSSMAQSSALRAIGPAWSRLEANAIMP